MYYLEPPANPSSSSSCSSSDSSSSGVGGGVGSNPYCKRVEKNLQNQNLSNQLMTRSFICDQRLEIIDYLRRKCLRTRVGAFVVLLFLCTLPCLPSAPLSACCRNQSFPENKVKQHQAIIWNKSMILLAAPPSPVELSVSPIKAQCQRAR